MIIFLIILLILIVIYFILKKKFQAFLLRYFNTTDLNKVIEESEWEAENLNLFMEWKVFIKIEY